MREEGRFEDTFIEMILKEVKEICEKYCIEVVEELSVVEHFPYRFALLSEYAKYCVYSVLALDDSDELLDQFDQRISYSLTQYLDEYYDEERVVAIMGEVNALAHLVHDGIYDCKMDKNFYYHQLVYMMVDQRVNYRSVGDAAYDDDMVQRVHDVNIKSINETLQFSTKIANEVKKGR